MIKAVFIDIDETLLNSQRKISTNTKKQIKQCVVDKGIKIILTSGRSRKDAIEYQKEIGASPYIISSNGASAYDALENKEIYNETLKKETVKKLLNYANNNEYKINLNYKDKLVLNKAFYPDEKDKERTIEQLEEIAEKEPVVQCVLFNTNIEKMREFKAYLEKEFNDIQIINQSKKLKNPNLPESKNYYCDVTSKLVSKGKAVQSICEYLQIKKEEIITIGDGENDISMFEITPNSIAMKNAQESVKKHAKYITDSNDEDGVAKVLEKI